MENKIELSDLIYYAHHLSAIDWLVLKVFLCHQYHYAVTAGELTEYFYREGVQASQKSIEYSLELFCHRGFLSGNPSTGKYFVSSFATTSKR
ncbi:hypothetical protein [Coleofasciculus sp. FACHB-1120]|uniref:hypothetical protein n=1 Tax=Coleofasciculus sp. FACHB-1120 TaxID=2692783 RepID=UPI0016849304|nr:hypothetical protein [Coleofasciculus sp. FACHB-1120]MBD2743683.1 hypothetical protein [Coleofasciculus sp. FACHB-1120]